MEGRTTGRKYLKTGGASVPPPFRRIYYGQRYSRLNRKNGKIGIFQSFKGRRRPNNMVFKTFFRNIRKRMGR